MVNALFGTAEFGNSNFNVVIITLTIADNVAAGDSFTSKTQFKRTNSDSTGLADGFKAKPKKSSADSVALNDNQSRKWNTKISSGDSASVADGFISAPQLPIAEGVGLADSFSFSWQTQQAMDDSVAPTDAFSVHVEAPLNDAIGQSDSLMVETRPVMADTCVPNEAVSKIIKVHINDSAAVADNQSKDTGKATADYIIVRDERGLTPHIGPWEESFEYGGIRWNRSGSGYTALGTSGGLFGSNFAKVIDESTHAWKAWYGSTSYTLQPGKWYRASVYAYSPQVRGSYAYLFYNSTESRIVKSATWGTTELGPDKGWVRKESRFQVPADATILTGIPYLYGHINPNGLTSSEVWYDGYLLEGPFDTDPGPIGAPAQFNMSIQKADTAALADNVTRIWDAINALADSIGLSDNEFHKPKQSKADAAALADQLAMLWQAKISAGDTAALADDIARKTAIVETEILSAIDDLALKAKAAMNDALALGDETSKKAMLQLADTLAMLDSIAFLVHALHGDSVTVTDTITAKPRPVKADTISLAEELSRAWQAYKQYDDSLALGDAQSVKVKPTEADTVTITDAASTIWQAAKEQNDAATPTDALAKKASRILDNSLQATVSNDADSGVAYEQFVDADYGPALRIVKPDGTNLYSYWSFVLPGTIKAGNHEIKWLMKTTNVQNMTGYSNNLFAELYCPNNNAYSQHISGTTGWTEYTWNLTVASDITGMTLWFVIDRAYGTAELAQLRMDGLPVWPIEQVALTDSLSLKAKPTTADVLAMVDNLTNKIASLRTDTLILADTLAARLGFHLADSISLVEAIAAMVNKPQDDSVAAADALALKAKVLMQDSAGVADGTTLKAKPTIADALAIVDAVSRLIKPRVTDTIAAADAVNVVWHAYKAAADALSVSDGVTVATDKILADTAALGDNVAKYFSKSLPGGVYFGEATFGKVVFGGGTDPVALSDSFSLRPVYLFEDLVTLSDELANLISTLQADSVEVTESFAREWTAFLNNSDAIVLAEALAHKIAILKGDTAGLSDTLNRSWQAKLAMQEPIDAADTIAVKPKPYLEDSAGIADAMAMMAKVPLADGAGLSDALARAWQAKQAQSDAAGTEDAASVKVTVPKADSTTVSDELISIWGIVRGNGDSIALADALVKLWQAKLAAGDSLTAMDDVYIKAMLANGDTISTTDSLLHAWQALSEINENTSLADEVALLTMAAYGCSVGVTDALKQKASKALTEALALSESIAAKIGVKNSEAVSIADDLIRKIGNSLDEAVAAEEFISKHISIALPRNLFNLVAFGEGAFGNSEALQLADALMLLVAFLRDYADSVAMADELTMAIRMGFNDSSATADSLATIWTAKLGQTDLIGATDAVLAKFSALKADSVNVTDSMNAIWQAKFGIPDSIAAADTLFLKSRVQLIDSATIADVFASTWAAKRQIDDSLASLVDNLIMKAGTIVQDNTNISDGITKKSGVSKAESVSALDSFAIAVSSYLSDSAALNDWFAVNATKLLDDSAGVSDAASMVADFKRQWDEIAALAEQLELLLGKPLGDALSLTDAVSSKAGKVYADGIGVVDSATYAPGKYAADALALLDSLLFKFSQYLADSVNITEGISKKVGKTGEELLAVLDQMAARIKAVLACTVHAEDAMLWKIGQARNEAIAIAEAMGIEVSKLPADMVGVLDLNILMPMLLKQDSTGLLDDVTTKRVVILNQVWVNGVSIPVADLKITQSVSERLSSCTFSIPNPSPEVLAICQQRADVKAFLTDGEGAVEYFGGRLKANPIQTQNAITTRLDITALDYADAANDVLVSEIYESETGIPVPDIVKDLWGKYAPYEIDLGGITASTKTIPYAAFKYDTLFDATEYLAQLLGWSWYVDWNGSKKTLYFYPPGMALKDITLSRANCNVIAGSAKFGQNEKIYNRIYVLGGTTLSGTVTYEIVADGTNTIYSLPHKGYAPDGQEMIGVTLNSNPLAVGYEYPYWPSGKDVLYSFQGKYLRWPDANKPAAGAVIKVSYRHEYPVGYVMEDPVSIERFGLSETRYIDSKINDARQAREKAQSMLQEYAYPVGYGTLETTETGLRAGDFIKVDLPHVGGSGTYEIAEIEKWVERSVVRRMLTLNMADDPEARIAARLKEYADKLAKLELKDLEDDAMIMDIKAITEMMNISETIIFVSDYKEADSDTIVPSDECFAKPEVVLTDNQPLSGHLFVAISTGNCQFGAHTFGSAHFAIGQTVYD